jgi:hypothetical protein
MVAWEDWMFGASDIDILARRIKGDGTYQVGGDITISSAAGNQTKPAVAGYEHTQEYLVVWTQDKQAPALGTFIAGCQVSIGGALPGPESGIEGVWADHAAVVSGPVGDFLVAFEDAPSLTQDIHGHLWGSRVYLPLVVRNASIQ